MLVDVNEDSAVFILFVDQTFLLSVFKSSQKKKYTQRYEKLWELEILPLGQEMSDFNLFQSMFMLAIYYNFLNKIGT